MKDLTKQIVKLRTDGKSYKTICDTLECCKSHVSYICSKYVPNNQELRARLIENLSLKSEHLAKAGRAAKDYYSNLKIICKKDWLERLKQYPDQNFIYYISGLYDGEGNHSGTEFRITNSDSRIITACVKFVKDAIRAKFTTSLTLHSTHNRVECIKFWMLAGVNIDYVYQIDSRKQKRDYTYKENYGTIRIRIKTPLGLRNALAEYSYAQ